MARVAIDKGQTSGHARKNYHKALPQNQPDHTALACAKRHADANLARPLCDRVRDHSVKANAGEQQREEAKDHRKRCYQALTGKGQPDPTV